jgi:hypothetical protein
VKILKSTVLLGLALFFLSLTVGVNVYSVHCHMRDADFISLQAGNDPCLQEIEASCCTHKTACTAEQTASTEKGCCDEKSILLSYEPDHYSQISYQIPHFEFLPYDFEFSVIRENEIKDAVIFAAYPQPPPLSSAERRARTQIWRI